MHLHIIGRVLLKILKCDTPNKNGKAGKNVKMRNLTPKTACVEKSPRTKDVERIYLDFWIAETKESDDDVLIVRDEDYVLAAADKKVIHWAKVVVKHSATDKLPLELESSGEEKKLYFYGEQDDDPNQLTADPPLKDKLSKEFKTDEWFWIGTDVKGPGEGKFKAKGNLGTGLKEAPEEKTVRLLPVDLAVDADRDGEITFDGNDKTTAEKPFRFWINNDQDNVEADEPVTVTTADSANTSISTKRDLEDLTRIRLSVGLPLDQLKNGSWKAGLRFKNTGGQAPTIRIWANESGTGSDEYVNDGTAAGRQIAKQTFGETSGGTVFIPQSYWQERSDTEAHLIFEGISKGTGELALIIQNSSQGPEIESATVHLKLLDVREMFQRARVVNPADAIPNPWIDDTPPAQTWVWDPWNWSYDEDPDAEEITAIFVHGWRLTYDEYLNWAQSSYKRLWHQGFKGKFYTFRWATLSGDQSNFEGYLTYNPSEYRAWLCGSALASWVNSLPNAGRRSLFAHSMGNVISGAALRNGMSVQRYALCNAAMASMAYDSGSHLKLNPDTGQPWSRIWGNLGPQKTPDTDPSTTIRNSYGLQNKFNDSGNLPEMINFYLPEDEALDSWVDNNRLFKPDDIGHSYYYQESPIAPNIAYKLFQAPPVGNPREVTSQQEAFGYVTKSLTRAAGADSRTGGSVNSSVNMNDWSAEGAAANHSGFGKIHSAQWRWNYQSTHLFWMKLASELQLQSQ